MKNILIATHNKAKLQELLMGVKDFESKGVKVLTLNDVGVEKDPEETGKTFEENAIFKSKILRRKNRDTNDRRRRRINHPLSK